MTEPIDIEIARSFLKADGDDDDLITLQIASARTICEDYCNRKFYDSATAMEDDFILALSDRSTAISNRANALASITGMTPDDWQTKMLIESRYIDVFAQISQRMHGMVIDDAINAAILITLGHIYMNREDNVSTGNNVVQVPVGAQRILQTKLWIGDLAGEWPTPACYIPTTCGS